MERLHLFLCGCLANNQQFPNGFVTSEFRYNVANPHAKTLWNQHWDPMLSQWNATPVEERYKNKRFEGFLPGNVQIYPHLCHNLSPHTTKFGNIAEAPSKQVVKQMFLDTFQMNTLLHETLDVCVFIVACHGSASGELLLSRDGDGTTSQDVLGWWKESKKDNLRKKLVMIIDCCHSQNFAVNLSSESGIFCICAGISFGISISSGPCLLAAINEYLTSHIPQFITKLEIAIEMQGQPRKTSDHIQFPLPNNLLTDAIKLVANNCETITGNKATFTGNLVVEPMVASQLHSVKVQSHHPWTSPPKDLDSLYVDSNVTLQYDAMNRCPNSTQITAQTEQSINQCNISNGSSISSFSISTVVDQGNKTVKSTKIVWSYT